MRSFRRSQAARPRCDERARTPRSRPGGRRRSGLRRTQSMNGSADHRPGVVQAERGADARRGRRRWCAARCGRPCCTGSVHCAGDPVGQRRVAAARRTPAPGRAACRRWRAGCRSDSSVSRPQAARAAQLQPVHDEADAPCAAHRVREVVRDVGIVEPQRAGGRVVAVALLGDGQADDAGVGVRRCARSTACGSSGATSSVEHAADDLQRSRGCAVGVGIAQRQRVQALLRRQRVARVGLAQRHADDAPAQVAARRAARPRWRRPGARA